MRTWDHACINSRVEVHVRCVEGALGLRGHVVIGVVRLVARFHHAYALPSVARSVQIWAQYFNIGFVKTRRMISDRDQQIRMLFLTQQFRMLFLTQHVELTSHGCVRQEIAIVQQTSHCYQNARATRDHTC